MKVRRYVARDMRTALNQVRAEQGPDVVILSNRKVDGGVEIITAEEYDEGLLETESRLDSLSGEVEPARLDAVVAAAGLEDAIDVKRDESARPAQDTKGPEILWTKDSLLNDMRDEIQSLRSMFDGENQILAPLASKLQAAKPQAKRETMKVESKLDLGAARRIGERLERIGLSGELISNLVANIAADSEEKLAWTQTTARLCKAIPIAKESIFKQGGIFAFFGATGVGKTSAIAKLAVRYSLEFDREAVGLITTDNKRIGAFEQLRTFGEMSGLAVWTVSTSKELLRALTACHNKPLVLIDSAGMTFSRDPAQNPVAIFADCLSSIKSYLVLSATAQAKTLQRIRSVYTSIDPAGIVVTKVDEAASLGPVISELVGQTVPLSYLSSGQRVPEDIDEARAHHLVSAAIALAQHDPISGLFSEPMETSMSGTHLQA